MIYLLDMVFCQMIVHHIFTSIGTGQCQKLLVHEVIIRNNQVTLGNIDIRLWEWKWNSLETSHGRDTGLPGSGCGLHQSIELHERDAVVSASSLISPFKVTQTKCDNWQKQRTELFILEIIIHFLLSTAYRIRSGMIWWYDLSMWGQCFIVLILRNPNLRSWILHGNEKGVWEFTGKG